MIPGKDWIGKYCLSQEVIKIAFNEMKKELLIIYFESEAMQPSLVRYVDIMLQSSQNISRPLFSVTSAAIQHSLTEAKQLHAW